jgi:hypothetical protein
MVHSIGYGIRVDPVDIAPASVGDGCGNSQGVRFRIAPGKHQFAADAVFELPLALDDQDACATLGHILGKGCATHAAAGYGQIIGC